VPLDVANLRGYFVVEIGMRQAWPFVAFASNDADADPAEARLYIDSSFTVAPAPSGSGNGSEDEVALWLLRLEPLLSAKVRDVHVEPDGTLEMLFVGDTRLCISGTAAAWTTHDVWWLATR
jgi:hypothetical protein